MAKPQQGDFLGTWLSSLSHDLPDGEVSGYIALGGKGEEPARGFAIVSLPTGVGPQAIGRSIETGQPTVSERISAALQAHDRQVRELETALAEKSAYIEELLADRDRVVAAAVAEAEAARDQRAEELAGEIREWRKRAAIAEGEALRARTENPIHAEDVARIRAELESVQAEIERATDNWRQAEKRGDTAWRRVGEIQSELEEHREKSIARSAEQRRSAQLELARARDEASGKLVAVRDQLIRSERRVEALEQKLADAEAARAELESAMQRADEGATTEGDLPESG